MTTPPAQPKVYHIAHVDRLAPILTDGFLWSDGEMAKREPVGTTIGMGDIKRRRLHELRLASHPGLHVGECVPFYFCPRSIMLYLISCRNPPELAYLGGQEPIIHLEADLRETVRWAQAEGARWAFTLSNAGSYHFEDRCDLSQLHEVDWSAVAATDWRGCKDGKQAEFLIEQRFPWHLVRRIGVHSPSIHGDVVRLLHAAGKKCHVEVIPNWYY